MLVFFPSDAGIFSSEQAIVLSSVNVIPSRLKTVKAFSEAKCAGPHCSAMIRRSHNSHCPNSRVFKESKKFKDTQGL